jgi:hypothetical protein
MAGFSHVLLAECADHRLGLRFGFRLQGQRGCKIAVPCKSKTARRCGPSARGLPAQLRCVTRSLRDPEAFCLRRLAFFQDGLMRALRAMPYSYGLVPSSDCGSAGSVRSRPLR